MKTINSIFKLTIVFAIFSMACKGPAGDTGPAGPAGAQGAAGAVGAKGDPGSVNITTTPWITVKPVQWNLPDTKDSSYYIFNIADKAITQTVLDKGAIMVYFKGAKDTNYILPLPYTASVFQISYVPVVDAKNGGLLEIDFQAYIANLSPADIGDLAFRYVIIPDMTVRTGRLKAINWKDYEEVKRELNLKD